jgi:hypothetical protein
MTEERYRQAFKRYVKLFNEIEPTCTLADGAYEEFVYICRTKGSFYKRWVKEVMEPLPYIKRLKIQ